MQRWFQLAFSLSIALALFLTLRPIDEPTSPPFPHFDKVAHAGMWFLMGALGGGALKRRTSQLLGLLAALCLLGVAVEVAHLWIPGRSFEWLDAVADGTGAAAAIGLWLFWITWGGDPDARPQRTRVV